jgi:hypothetical protein
MSTNTRIVVLISAVLAVSTAQPAWAQGQVGTRAAGMAGAFVAVADDATAVYWNPAGVGTGAIVSAVFDAGRFQTGSSERQRTATKEDTGAVLAFSATAFGLAYYRLGTFATAAEPAVVSLDDREEVRHRVHALTTSTVGVSLVHSLSEHIIVGVTPKVMRGSGRNAIDVDAGLIAWVDRFRFGLVGRNLTTPTFGGGARDAVELDREVTIGGAWGSGWTGISRVIVSVDGELLTRPTLSGDRRDVAAGVETWWLQQRLGLRGGVRRSTIGEPRGAVTAGISAGLKPGMLVEAHFGRGANDEHSWSVGARMTF